MDPLISLLLLAAAAALYGWADRRRLAPWLAATIAQRAPLGAWLAELAADAAWRCWVTWRRLRAAERLPGAPRPMPAPPPLDPPDPLDLARQGPPVAGGLVTAAGWLALLNDQPDRYPHVLIIGPTGAGKTTFARALLAGRPGRVAIVTPKPDMADWPGAPIVTIDDTGQFTELTAAFDALAVELRARLVAAKHGRPAAEQLTIIADDWPVLASECGRPASDVFKMAARLGRSLRVRLLVLSQSERVKSLGLDGEGDALDNFARVELARGHRATLVADGERLPLDTSCVPALAGRPAPAGRWWVLPEAEALPSVSGRSDAVEALPVLPGSTPIEPAGSAGSAGSVEAPEVTAEERAAIVAAAQVERSRRRVCQTVFNTTGGRAYAKVAHVCDAEGLLVEPAPSVASA